MRSTTHTGLLNYAQRLARLRYMAVGLAMVLLIPLMTLAYFGYQQMLNNQLAEYQREANTLMLSIDRNLFKRRLLTNAFGADEFEFYKQVYNPLTRQSEKVPSPLSQFNYTHPKLTQQVKGLVGFFQYNYNGVFNSPIWPFPLTGDGQTTNVEQQMDEELIKRKHIAEQVHSILTRSETIQRLLAQKLVDGETLFNLSFDVPEYFIFYRVIPVNNQSAMQGYIVSRKPYLSKLFTDMLDQRHFNTPVLASLKQKESAGIEYFFYQEGPDAQVDISHPAEPDSYFQQQTILATPMRWPFEEYSVTLSTHKLPFTQTMLYSGVFITILITATLLACYGFYRLGVKQLSLAEQRLNFVSSVSHELKTPLTSIRMYSEMLKSGTILSDDHKSDYYEFIYTESERLKRLINNILQLSKLNHQQQVVQAEYIELDAIKDMIRSKISTQLEKAEFQLNIRTELKTSEATQLFVDKDALSQVFINITDNTIKFFDQQIEDQRRQKLDVTFRPDPNHKQMIQIEIRDYGVGITAEQETKIFNLFYRGESELTRTTKGTGIGLALVRELMHAQQGEASVKRKDPGLAIVLSFKAKY